MVDSVIFAAKSLLVTEEVLLLGLGRNCLQLEWVDGGIGSSDEVLSRTHYAMRVRQPADSVA